MLRKYGVAVSDDVENTLIPFDQLGLDTKLVIDLGRQTGGLRKIVSTDAIRNRYLHVGSFLGITLDSRFSEPGFALQCATQLFNPQPQARTNACSTHISLNTGLAFPL